MREGLAASSIRWEALRALATIRARCRCPTPNTAGGGTGGGGRRGPPGRYGLRANRSVSAQAAVQHPNVIAAVIKAGHEINGHGWVNDVHPNGNEEEEADIRRCTAVLTQVAGAPPVGWTGPGSAGSPHALSLLKEPGYPWDGGEARDDLH